MSRCMRINDIADSIVGSVFHTIRIEVEEAIREVGEDPDNYIISPYPFKIERLDKRPVSVMVLLAAKRRLATDDGE